MRPLIDIRRDNLRRLIEEVTGGDADGNGAEFGRRVGKDRRQVSAWLAERGKPGAKGLSERTARELERKCLKPSGWLDHEETKDTVGGQGQVLASKVSQPVGMDPVRMRDVATLLGFLNEMQAGPAALPSDPDAIAATYNFLTELGEPVTESNILYLSKLIAAKLKTGGSTNGNDQERSKAS